MIRPSAGKPSTFLHVIATIFNTKALDIAFRCISGSVAVSAFELNTLPLPSPDDMKAIEKLLRNGAAPEMIEKKVARIYGVEGGLFQNRTRSSF
jgi:adenine-specific DNA-methyltransferase